MGMINIIIKSIWENVGPLGLVFLIVLSFFLFTVHKQHTNNTVTKKPLEAQPGYFMTSDILQTSYFITRMVDNDGDGVNEGICIIQRQIPNGVFENCVEIDGFYGIMEQHKGYITKESKYTY